MWTPRGGVEPKDRIQPGGTVMAWDRPTWMMFRTMEWTQNLPGSWTSSTGIAFLTCKIGCD